MITAQPNSKLGADTKSSEVKECRIEEEEDDHARMQANIQSER